MLRNKISAAMLAAFLIAAGTALAQSSGSNKQNDDVYDKDETVIIRKEKPNGRTELEIKGGTLFLNGEPLVTVHDRDAEKVRKKIIIEHGDGSAGARIFTYPDEGGDEGDRSAATGRRRAMLGVGTDAASDRVGALVKTVQPGSAAGKAGLQEGDLITRVDGKTIKDPQQLVSEIMSQHEPGDQVTIGYERDGRERTTTAKLGASAAPPPSARAYSFERDGSTGGDGTMPNPFFRSFPFGNDVVDELMPAPKLGASVEDRADGDGVRILSVKPGAAAAGAGLKEGDVIMRIGGSKVASVDALQDVLRGSRGGDKLKVEYQRADRLATADVTLPKAVKKADL